MTRVVWLVALPLVSACTSRGLTNEELSSVVQSRRTSLDACYQAELEERPVKSTLAGKATLVIEASGEVSSVYVAGELAPLPGLKACLERTLKGWRFPEATAETRTSLPLRFEPRVEPAGAEAAP